MLDQLVTLASQQSISLVKLVSALSRPWRQRAVIAGSLFPQTQDLFGELTQTSAARTRPMFSRPNDVTQGRGGLRTFSNYRLGGSLAWELDFWGRFRRAVEAADARLDSSIENYDDAGGADRRNSHNLRRPADR